MALCAQAIAQIDCSRPDECRACARWADAAERRAAPARGTARVERGLARRLPRRAARPGARCPTAARRPREYIVHPGAVMVVPLLDDGAAVWSASGATRWAGRCSSFRPASSMPASRRLACADARADRGDRLPRRRMGARRRRCTTRSPIRPKASRSGSRAASSPASASSTHGEFLDVCSASARGARSRCAARRAHRRQDADRPAVAAELARRPLAARLAPAAVTRAAPIMRPHEGARPALRARPPLRRLVRLGRRLPVAARRAARRLPDLRRHQAMRAAERAAPEPVSGTARRRAATPRTMPAAPQIDDAGAVAARGAPRDGATPRTSASASPKRRAASTTARSRSAASAARRRARTPRRCARRASRCSAADAAALKGPLQ